MSGRVVSRKKEFTWSPAAGERRWVYIVIHHSGTNAGSVSSIHREHRQRKDSQGNPWLGIGYHFVIGNGDGMEDGLVEATFRWEQQLHGAHSGSAVHNDVGIGVCLIGNFQEHQPTQKQLGSVTRLLNELTGRYGIPPRLVIGHQTVRPTACPGQFFPLQDVIREAVSDG
ncbi:MAG: peptidoglycan recognition family protein [Planctomycetaceae bacterium]